MNERTLGFNVIDISDAVAIIDFAAEQGAFKGWSNIRQVLMVRDRLETFVKAFNATQNINNPASALNEEDAGL